MHTLEGHTEYVQTIAFHPNSKTLASGSTDNTVKIWSVTTGQCLAMLNQHKTA